MKTIILGTCACLVSTSLLVQPASAVVVNGFDSNTIFVLRQVNGTPNEDYPDGEVRKIDETNGSDQGRFGTAQATLVPDGSPKSICFSNSPTPGVNSPAGTRFFGIEITKVPIVPHNPTDSANGFQIVEFDANGNRLRILQPGVAVGALDRRSLVPPNFPDPNDPNTYTFDNVVRLGTIRYNPAKNTLAVSCNVNANNNTPSETDKGMVYEFELPDWPAATNGNPGPVSAITDVKLVQIYEMPTGHNIQGSDGNINHPLVVDFDNDGNMYCTSRFFNATMTLEQILAQGTPDPYYGDIVRVNTMGHNSGKNVYVVPVSGADASNLIVRALFEYDQGHTEYSGGWGLSSRPSARQLVTIPRGNCDPNVHINLFDLDHRVGGTYPNQLVRTKFIPGDVQSLPRQCIYAQRDLESGKIYMGNQLGACSPPGGPQNFMYLNDNSPADTLTKDVGYDLSIDCLTSCTLNKTWDAASPPAPIAAVNSLVSAASRRAHSAAGTLDISVPLSGAGIEPRQAGSAPAVVLTFASPPAASDGTLDCTEFAVTGGNCTGVTVSGNSAVIALSGLAKNTCLTVTVSGIAGFSGANNVSVLLHEGNSNGNGGVNILDLQVIKNQLNQSVTAANAAMDVNCTGTINILDLQATKNNLNQSASCP